MATSPNTTDTHSDAEQQLDAMRSLAPLFQAQMAFDQSIQNHLTADGWAAAAAWAERFRDLYVAVVNLNDSILIARVLEDHYWPDVDGRIEHYRRMAGIHTQEGEPT